MHVIDALTEVEKWRIDDISVVSADSCQKLLLWGVGKEDMEHRWSHNYKVFKKTYLRGKKQNEFYEQLNMDYELFYLEGHKIAQKFLYVQLNLTLT